MGWILVVGLCGILAAIMAYVYGHMLGLNDAPEAHVEYVEAWIREPILDVGMMAEHYSLTARQIRYRCENGDIPAFQRSGVWLAWAGDLPGKWQITAGEGQ